LYAILSAEKYIISGKKNIGCTQKLYLTPPFTFLLKLYFLNLGFRWLAWLCFGKDFLRLLQLLKYAYLKEMKEVSK